MNDRANIGIIGGSGLYDLEALENPRSVSIETPFGSPSDDYILGRIHGLRAAFLPRHGRSHTILPSELNSRANVYGLKKLGVRRILGVGAVGSLRSHIEPRDLALPDQVIDRTRGREETFFGDGIVAHVALAEPFCQELREAVLGATESVSFPVHDGGVYLCMEGPQFSTRAESELYRDWGGDYIGMTLMPEAKLAREAEICYSSLNLISDYDAWYVGGEEGDAEKILEHLQIATERARTLLDAFLKEYRIKQTCECESALDGAILTPLDEVPRATLERLEMLLPGESQP